MRWLWFIFALGSFAVAFRTHSMGLAVISLLAALVFVLMGTLALAASRIESRGRHESAMLDPAEMQRMREQIERRKREGDGGATVATGGVATSHRRDVSEMDIDSVSDSGGND